MVFEIAEEKMTWTLIMVLTTGGLAIIPGFNSAQQCRLAGAQARIEYAWLLPRTCVEVGGPVRSQGPKEWDFEDAANEAAQQTDAKYCAEGRAKGNEFLIKVFCKKQGENK